jgi:formylglycine-generating enzyme required for sulfatase activity/uncharacterized caspase-like protein
VAKNWAIVVGVNAYKSIGDLKYANRDAEAMRDFFNEAQFDRVICFADELAGAMLPSFTELEDFLQDQFTADPLPLAPGDNCWFFFAGHGKRIDDCDYLLPIDYNPRMANSEKRAISVNFVREALLKSGADNVILLLDACRTEGDRSDGIGIGEAQPGAITIFSCQRHRKAYEIEALQQGAFTSALLEALRMPGERNCATVERLDLYLRDRVPQLCQLHNKPEQVPMTLVEPRQKSYLILLPQFATEKDIVALKSQAQGAELAENFEIAEQLWFRYGAVSGDREAYEAYSRVKEKNALRMNPNRQTRFNGPVSFGNSSRSASTSTTVKRVDRPVPATTKFTRRTMLYLGLGGLGTVGTIALGLNNSRQPQPVPPSPSPTPLPPSPSPSPSPSPTPQNVLESFQFPTVKLNPKGEIIKRETLEWKRFSSAFDIKMVKIPSGTFKMGSPETETDRSKSEGPQRTVSVSEFFMSQHVVTQAQWRAVSALPKRKIDLKADPSIWKGDWLPVEQVSWAEAIEFCDRLSIHTGLDCRLPTEAQWEYACRAGTETSFYFGETLSTEVANYNGNSTYGAGPKGKYLEKTTAVGSYPANGWGLYDMHGNVWEWCLDLWHSNYDGAPKDDRVWDTSNNGSRARILRGGVWRSVPGVCRSAHRDVFLDPTIQSNCVGFRVACLF